MPGLDRAVLVDIGLELCDRLPEDGVPKPMPTVGRVRN